MPALDGLRCRQAVENKRKNLNNSVASEWLARGRLPLLGELEKLFGWD
jgi:hypothetical protein